MNRVGRARVTFDSSGRAYISRNCPDAIAYLDKCMDRLPNQMAWEPRTCFDKCRSLNELLPLFSRNKHCYIVGKGKSADALTGKNFPTTDPIICINDAVLFIEGLGLPNQVIGIRQDLAVNLKIAPKKAIMVVLPLLIGEYMDYPNTYLFDMKKDFNVQESVVTTFVGILLAHKMRSKVITMYGFDAFTVKNVEYGVMANHRNKSNDNRHILNQRAQLKHIPKGLKVRWVLPDLESFLMDV